MIKFNNFPPVDPGDVELTNQARADIASWAQWDFSDNEEVRETVVHNTLRGMGIATAIVVLNATEDPSKAYELLQPVIEEATSIVGEKFEISFLGGTAVTLSEYHSRTGVQA